ncbi:phospholipid N-methyltransferase PmtA [Rhizobium sp. L1K21]|uniref:phospholipid N-methyltransferase PmtA n=1 Tax=Rhizobium sp. L1K21 TaxID=2954933 RepID=UPI003593E5AB
MVVQRVKSEFGKRFEGEIKFFRGMMDGPKQVGAILPTSSVTARRMASVINPASGLPVLELGPGTGSITKAILQRIEPKKLVSVEYSDDFYNHLTKLYPGVNFIRGDAFQLDDILGDYASAKFDCIISAIPMLNFPVEARKDLLESLLDRVPAGNPVVQISYGPVSPIGPRPGKYIIKHLDFVMRNIPPAQLWTYRRPAQ